jgi:glycosyltransferase involved in cell wall biosynthesis
VSETPQVSICMPAFNGARWLRTALESVLAQTWGDFELILADNASTDDTVEIAKSYGDSRVRVVPAERPIGAIANHNRAIRLSRGEFVKFLDADDQLLPDCLEAMVGLALEDERIALVFAPRRVVLDSRADAEWAKTYGRPHEHFQHLGRINEGHDLFRELLEAGFEENWIGEPSNVLVRRRTFERVGLFNEHIFQVTDLELWARIAYGHRVGFIDRILSVYRHHALSGTTANARVERDWFDQVWLLEGLLTISNLTPEERSELRRLRRQALRRTLRTQIRRLAERRWTPELASYLTYRVSGGRSSKRCC